MVNIKEVLNPELGRVRVLVTDKDSTWFCLQDICILLGIKYQEARCNLGERVLEVLTPNSQRNSYKPYISFRCIEELSRTSQEKKLDEIIMWLEGVSFAYSISFDGITIDDLKEEGIAIRFLNRLKEMELNLAVLMETSKEAEEKIKFVDMLYGTKVPLDMKVACTRLKYQKVSYKNVLDDLRNSGIFNESNQPHQKYIDEKFFRLVSITTIIGTEEVVRTRVLVFQKGIRLIEDMIERKVGIKSGRKGKS